MDKLIKINKDQTNKLDNQNKQLVLLRKDTIHARNNTDIIRADPCIIM